MKRNLIIIISLALLVAFATAAMAEDITQVDVYDQQENLVKSVVFVIGKDEYFINNKVPGIKMDAVPFISKEGRTFVPVRYLSNALGVTDKNIGWESPKVTLSQPGMPLVELEIGSKIIKSDNSSRTMDVSPVLKNGRTYLPARFVAEALGYQVAWDGKNDVVLCWPKGAEKPDISDVIESIGGEVPQEPAEEQPVDEGETYKLNGFTVPKDTDLKIESDMGRNQLEIGIMLFIDKPNLEKQYQDAYDIVASKFGDDVAQEVIDYVKQKDNREDELDKWWTVNGQEMRVSTAMGLTNVNIHIWAPGA